MTNVLQLKITLEGISPKIWRRLLVKDNITFQKLHDIIQIVMGWGNYHMFEFQIGDMCISADEEGHNLAESSFKKLYQSPEFLKMLKQTKMKNGSASLDVNKLNRILKEQEKNKPILKHTLKTKICELLNSEGQKFLYVYDFGDNWEHTLVVEKIQDSKGVNDCPVCLEGERACPPEDCGSVPGYYELIKIKKNKNHPEYEERVVEWLGEDFDFEKFNLDEINKELPKQNIKIDGRTRYWVPK